MDALIKALRDRQFLKDTGQGLTDSVNRGAFAGLLGGPVDAVSGVVNAGLMGLGYAGNKLGLLSADRMPQPIQKPVGGSEWIGDLLQRGGMVSENRNAPAEMLAGLLAPSAVKGASKAAFAAENNAMAPTPYNSAARNQLGATVWHGSPHKFDKFDSSKIGTGEGKQQQGIGSYLAEAPQVAQKYADKESWKRGMDSGYLYKVDIPDEMISSMANHELPISKQPLQVKKIIESALDDGAKKALNDYHGWSNFEDAPFAAVMDAIEISKGNNRAATSDFLRGQGIPGIKYLDGGSRTNGGGTSNFVVFPGNEGLLKILERNGQPIK